jgi:hypothetical protein
MKEKYSMPFLTDAKFARAVKNSYGDYMATFESDHHQVRADVFKQGEWLVAHVSFPTGLDIERVDDKYLIELQSYANQRGFSGKFRMIFS